MWQANSKQWQLSFGWQPLCRPHLKRLTVCFVRICASSFAHTCVTFLVYAQQSPALAFFQPLCSRQYSKTYEFCYGNKCLLSCLIYFLCVVECIYKAQICLQKFSLPQFWAFSFVSWRLTWLHTDYTKVSLGIHAKTECGNRSRYNNMI